MVPEVRVADKSVQVDVQHVVVLHQQRVGHISEGVAECLICQLQLPPRNESVAILVIFPECVFYLPFQAVFQRHVLVFVEVKEAVVVSVELVHLRTSVGQAHYEGVGPGNGQKKELQRIQTPVTCHVVFAESLDVGSRRAARQPRVQPNKLREAQRLIGVAIHHPHHLPQHRSPRRRAHHTQQTHHHLPALQNTASIDVKLVELRLPQPHSDVMVLMEMQPFTSAAGAGHGDGRHGQAAAAGAALLRWRRPRG
mmetsp:Transcript_8553/g.21084  ORF Transcript_8553/g.21084 Transcript_8553/m.21084 type:complete len:253 (+) Transcript_8553:229-987(+)